jgi:membrane protease YdiL (CAAX protease family)
MWILAGSVVAIVVRWEKLPMASIGLKPRWRSVLWGLALAVAFNRIVAPFLYWMVREMGIFGFETGLARVAPMPVWFLLFAALTGGMVEELMYRGFAIERLASITGSYWWAGLISTIAFALLHLPMWGWGPVATFLVSGGILTVFYILTRDLTACIICHTITDAVGFIMAHNAALAQ